MPLDAELEAAGFHSKARAKFFNRIWHPYLPRKVSALQWLILNEGLPVGAWREKLGFNSDCQICFPHARETLRHAFVECTEVAQAWDFFRRLRNKIGLPRAYHTWNEMSRGLMSEPEGPSVESDLQWDTASAFSINMETPWDILRAQLLWSIWRQRVAHAFDDERFHLGLVLWHAWQNSIYSAIEAYKELHRHKRNEEKRQEQIACFEEIWTTANIFARRQNTEIKWHLTPPSDFLPQALAAWMAPPIRINRLSPSPDLEADFTAQPDFQTRVQEFLDEIANNLHPHTNSHENSDLEPGPQEINQGAEATSQNPTPRPLSPAERPPIELNGSERPSTSRSPTTPGTFETTAQRNPLSSLNVNLQNLPRPSSPVNSSPGLGNHFDSATQNPPPPTKPKSRPTLDAISARKQGTLHKPDKGTLSTRRTHGSLTLSFVKLTKSGPKSLWNTHTPGSTLVPQTRKAKRPRMEILTRS